MVFLFASLLTAHLRPHTVLVGADPAVGLNRHRPLTVLPGNDASRACHGQTTPCSPPPRIHATFSCRGRSPFIQGHSIPARRVSALPHHTVASMFIICGHPSNQWSSAPFPHSLTIPCTSTEVPTGIRGSHPIRRVPVCGLPHAGPISRQVAGFPSLDAFTGYAPRVVPPSRVPDHALVRKAEPASPHISPRVNSPVYGLPYPRKDSIMNVAAHDNIFMHSTINQDPTLIPNPKKPAIPGKLTPGRALNELMYSCRRKNNAAPHRPRGPISSREPSRLPASYPFTAPSVNPAINRSRK